MDTKIQFELIGEKEIKEKIATAEKLFCRNKSSFKGYFRNKN